MLASVWILYVLQDKLIDSNYNHLTYLSKLTAMVRLLTTTNCEKACQLFMTSAGGGGQIESETKRPYLKKKMGQTKNRIVKIGR